MSAELRRTSIDDVFELRAQPFADDRGAFLNAFRAQEPAFMDSWGERAIAQVNFSRTEAVGTIRGCIARLNPTARPSWFAACVAGYGIWRWTYGQTQPLTASGMRWS